MDEHEDEIELMDYLNVLWRKKWLIILPTLFCVIAAGVISFLMPPKWEIDAIVQPSKFLVQTGESGFEELVFIEPKQIAGQINGASYNSLIAAELNMDIRSFPSIKAVNLGETNLVRVSIRAQDVKRAKSILYSLFNHLKRELDQKADIEIKEMDTKIKEKEIEKTSIEKEIEVMKKKLRIVKLRKKEIEDEMSDIKERIKFLEKEQFLTLKKEEKSESESLGLLLYSNEIQQSLMYLNTLNELLNRKKIEEEDLYLEVEKKEKTIKQAENEIENLNERKGRVDYAQLIKEPTSSLSPVSPKKKLIILFAGILSLMIFTILAFFLEYIKKHKAIS